MKIQKIAEIGGSKIYIQIYAIYINRRYMKYLKLIELDYILHEKREMILNKTNIEKIIKLIK